MSHRHLELAHVFVSEAVYKDSTAACVPKLPIANIRSSVAPVHAPLTISEVAEPWALINRTVAVSVLPILVPVSICITKTLVRAESFKKFFSGEIPCMHPVHVPHFNALSNRFPANTSPDKGLNADDRLDVALEHLLHFLIERKQSCGCFKWSCSITYIVRENPMVVILIWVV